MDDVKLWKRDYGLALECAEDVGKLLGSIRNEGSVPEKQVKRGGRNLVLAKSRLANLKEAIEHLENVLNLNDIYPSENVVLRQHRLELEDMITTLKFTEKSLQENLSSLLLDNVELSNVASFDLHSQGNPGRMNDGSSRLGASLSLHDGIIADQDNRLDDLSGKVEAMKFLSNNIHGEVALHTRILMDSVAQAETAERNISVGARVSQWSAQRDKTNWCLLFLFFSLVALFVFEVIVL